MEQAMAHKYQEQKIMTASPAELVSMLYEKAIASLNETVRAISEGDIERRYNANEAARNVIEHMILTLNIRDGGEIAENLERLFIYMMNRLVQVDMKNDPAPALEVIGLLEPLAKSWRMLASNPNATEQAAQASQQAAAKAITQAAAATHTAAKERPAADDPAHQSIAISA